MCHLSLPSRALGVILMILCSTVSAQQSLSPIEVWGYTLDGVAMMVPAGITGSLHMNRTSATPADSQNNPIPYTKDQVCSTLVASKPANCSTSTYPPAPGIPSASGAAWNGNGCGAGPWTTAFASGTLSALFGKKYSGNIDEPVAGNPSIDFTKICNQHDICYTTPHTQSFCDSNFTTNLTNFCSGSTDSADCNSFASAYETAVSNFGNGAYQADQAQMQCAAWGDAMKTDGC